MRGVCRSLIEGLEIRNIEINEYMIPNYDFIYSKLSVISLFTNSDSKTIQL